MVGQNTSFIPSPQVGKFKLVKPHQRCAFETPKETEWCLRACAGHHHWALYPSKNTFPTKKTIEVSQPPCTELGKASYFTKVQEA